MELLTVAETAAYLRVSQVTVRRYIKSKRLPAVRIGRNVRVRKDDVESLPDQPEGRVLKEEYLGPESLFWALMHRGYSSGGSDIRNHKDEYVADAIRPRK